MDKYLPRVIDPIIETHLATFGAVCVEGPKWCGKTWTCSHHSRSQVYLADPAGNFQNRHLAELDPSLILKGDSPKLIDEWQEVPAIWDAVRFRVDETGKTGQFLLTGSATPKTKGILHSGAGRISSIRMRPMSLWESKDSSGEVSLQTLCSSSSLDASMTGKPELEQIAKLIVRGGWPAVLHQKKPDITLIPKQYINAVIDNDIMRLDNISRNSHKMRLLLKSLARNVATTVTDRTIMRDVKAVDDEDIDKMTVSAYMDVLRRLFVIENVPAFSTNLRSGTRLKKAEKRLFCDPSLACSLLGATPEILMNDLETLGFLFESLCMRDLRIYAESFGASLYHYQDYANREVDAVVAMPDGSWCAFEIKLGANQIEQAAQTLKKLQATF
ncbi:MAG: ATP-binding protein, partial [Oxalobacter sp.]|nr:ATP-binding protein [Oxalobacter sp.]